MAKPEDGGRSKERRGASSSGADGELTHLTGEGVSGAGGRLAGLRSARVAERMAGGRFGGTKK